MVDLENGVFMEQVEDLVERKRWPDLRDMLCLLEPADISAILSELPEDRLPLLYRLLPKELAAEVFVEMEPEEQELLIKSFSDTELKEVLEELYPLVAPFGVARPALRVRAMRSRWGSCHYTKGVVVLSSHLLAKPRAAVEYVVLHELCHFLHPDHSQAFYGLLASLMPDWRQRKALLR